MRNSASVFSMGGGMGGQSHPDPELGFAGVANLMPSGTKPVSISNNINIKSIIIKKENEALKQY